MTDYQDWQTPQAHADTIAVTGVPLLHGSVNLLNQRNRALAAGNQDNFGLTFTKPGYDIFMVLQESVAGAIGPQATIIMNWGDTSSLQSVFAESWDIFIGSTGHGHQVKGYGPSRGDNLSIVVINNDTVQLNYDLVISQNSRVPSESRWYTDFMNGINGLASANDDVEALVIAASGPNVGAGANVLRAIGLYNGRAHLRGFATVPYRIRVQAVDFNLPGSPLTIAEVGTAAAGGGSTDLDITLPRSQCQLQLFNDGGAAATINASIIGEPI